MASSPRHPPAAPLSEATTTLASSLLGRIPDATARHRIAQHESAYKSTLRAARERERASIQAQESAVAAALQVS